MSKAEDYIREHTRTKINHLTENFPWLTTNDAQKAVEIAKEEIYKWLKEHSSEYVYYWMDEESGEDDLINDLKQAMKNE